jgi:hypothetical protein
MLMLNELLKDLSKAVSYAFRKDGTCPGVLVSTLKDGNIYASIVRYGSGDDFKGGKKVVCKCVASDVETAISGLATSFLENIGKEENPIDVLRNRCGK